MAHLEEATLASLTPVSPFERLKTYSRAEVKLLNWSLRAFSGSVSWEPWFQKGLAALLEVPRGTLVRLTHNNEFDASERKVYRSDRQEIRIGRDSECDLVLSLRVVSKQHARIFGKDGRYYLEDVGSAAGTYFNKKKLFPHAPVLLSDGDQFEILPYTFLFDTEQVWSAEDQFQFWQAPIQVTSWSEFKSTAELGSTRLQLVFHPSAGSAVLEMDRAFLSIMVQRLTRAPASRLVDSDIGVLEFLISSVLARANQELIFPFRFSLQTFQHCPGPEDVGLKLEVTIRLSELRSTLRAFIPEYVLDQFPSTLSKAAPPQSATAITWSVSVCAGYAGLSFSEIRELEPGDIVLFTPEISVLLPPLGCDAFVERGWIAKRISGSQYPVQLIDFFERNLLMEDGTPSNPAESRNESGASLVNPSDFGRLPIRLHVILSQTELSLNDLTGLAVGSIIELERGKNDPVHLAANGKLIGTGELVEVDGKLGVRITDWSAT